MTNATYFAASGLDALGLNWQSFLFQLISFVIVLVILKRFVFGKLVATLEARRQTVENSLKQAAETEAKLHAAEADVAKLLAEARQRVEGVIAIGRKEAKQLLVDAEKAADKRAAHIVAEASAQMDIELRKAREQLQRDTISLVATATEKIIQQKLTQPADEALIIKALAGAERKQS